jgi:hypothetical protein
MPYIPLIEREELTTHPPSTAGQLAYTITLELLREHPSESAIMQMCMVYLAGKKPCFDLYKDVMGVLECAYHEYRMRMAYTYRAAAIIQQVQTKLYHDVIFPYECTKREANGDVYPPGAVE